MSEKREGLRQVAGKIQENIQKVIIGKEREVELALLALICQGHMLIEDVPGVGKTMLAKSIARSLGCTYKRIQFTPDLLPSDITGVSVYNQKSGDFEFRPGPIIAQIVLADEINRASSKTQSALLECMEERQVTVDGVTHRLPQPFVVMATQNPIDYEGTFPLPETQLDRFLIRLSLGYPSGPEEITIMKSQQIVHPIEKLGQVVEASQVLELHRAAREIEVNAPVLQYIVSLVSATRVHQAVQLGASPRGSLALSQLAQARAMLAGRDFALPDDVKAVAEPALAHRMVIAPAYRMQGITGRKVVADVLEATAVPGALPGREV